MRRVIMLSAATLFAGTCAAATPPSLKPATAMDQFDWLVGGWIACAKDQTTEVWLKSRGDFLAGVNVSDSFFEYMRIARIDGVPFFIASPGGAAPTAFALIESGDAKAVFENKAHDFPQRVLYWREGADLVGRIEGVDDGRPQSVEWRFKPAAPGGAACAP